MLCEVNIWRKEQRKGDERNESRKEIVERGTKRDSEESEGVERSDERGEGRRSA
jgi:hypothetical protein